MSNTFFILFGTKDDVVYYINNTNPVIWDHNIEKSKLYFSKFSAEYDILRNYDNYKIISNLIDNNKLDNLYIASIENYIVKGREQLL